MSFASLDCDRLHVSLALGAASSRMQRVSGELRDALESRLAAALAPFAAARDDGATLFIERLEVEGIVGTSDDIDAIVRAVARRIAGAVSDEIDGGRGVRFQERADFIAAFVVALTDGTAWSNWWFEEFDGLKPLGLSNALRSAVLIDDMEGIRALARLTENAARKLVDALRPADAARIVAAMRMRASNLRAPTRLAWRLSGALEASVDESPGRWLQALIDCERALPGAAGETSVRMLLGMRWLRSIAGSVAGQGDPSRPLNSLLALATRCGGDLKWIGALGDVEAREILNEIALAEVSNRERTRYWTAWGGAFLLMARVSRLGWFDVWRGILEDAEARALALAIVATALAPRVAEQIIDDAALTAAFEVDGVRRRLRRKRCRQALESIGGGAADVRTRRARGALAGGATGAMLQGAATRLLEEFSARLPGMAAATPGYMRENVLMLGAGVERGEDIVRVTLGRASIDVVLVLSGMKRGRLGIPGIEILLEASEDFG